MIDGTDLGGTLLNNIERSVLNSMCDQALMDIVFAFAESAVNAVSQAAANNQAIILHEIREGHIH